MLKLFCTRDGFLEDYLNKHKLRNMFISNIKSSNGLEVQREFYTNGVFAVTVNHYLKPLDFKVLSLLEGVLQPEKGFIDVTNNELYNIDNLLDCVMLKEGCILEGGDLVGKTTVLTQLIQKGYICQDREVDLICPLMLDTVYEEDRFDGLVERIPKLKKKLVFLINTDEQELNRRFNERLKAGLTSEYDADAYFYSKMYLDSAERLEKYGISNFDYILGNNKNVVEIVKEVIESINN